MTDWLVIYEKPQIMSSDNWHTPAMSKPTTASPALLLPGLTAMALLKGVSRSFYLSIRLLPSALRAPIAVAYLLARATDTLADTSALPVADRADMLDNLARAIQKGTAADVEKESHVWRTLSARFAALAHDPAEQALLKALPECLATFRSMATADQLDIRQVLHHITQGQAQDLARFGASSAVQALANAQEVDAYTYSVAGCVGEFWTTLCFRHVPDFAQLPQAQMAALGRRFGMGLQRLNIIRDLQADLAAGRCYLPKDALAACGLAPRELTAPPPSFASFYQAWLDETQALLDDGMTYALAIQSRRTRAASALPALVGARTLALLRVAGPVAQTPPVKMPRAEMRTLLLRLACTLAGRQALMAHYRQLSAFKPPSAAMGQSPQ